MSRRPELLGPATSALEWDAKGQRAVRALIALLTSNVGCGVSGMARFWAGRVAVTEHITDPSAGECRIRARGRRKGHADPGGLLMGRSVDQDRDRWIAPGRFMDGRPWGRSVRAVHLPSGVATS